MLTLVWLHYTSTDTIVKRQRVQTPNKSIGTWLLCMMIVAQSNLQW